MYIVIDCETTGLPVDWKAPISDLDNWPRVVQLAWASYDHAGEHVESDCYLIRPDGFTIPLDAQRIHGITTERAQAEGTDLATALDALGAAIRRAKAVVAHNLQFDCSVISAEYLRLDQKPPFAGKKRICTMRESTDFCRLPGRYGFKWPNLSELHRKLFGKSYEEAHDAAADVQACARCFLELRERKVLRV